MRKLSGLLALLALLLIVGGCGTQPAGRGEPHPAVERVWPAPPAQPRIRYVGAVGGPGDWGIERGFFGRILDALSGQADEGFVRPTGVAERDGTLYVADPGAQALWILDREQNRFRRVRAVGGTQLVAPVAVARGPGDSVFLADTWLKQVYQLDREGRLIRIVAQDNVERPAAIAFDNSTERLYVADSVRHQISVYRVNGALVRTVGMNGAESGEFNSPTHLALDRNGTLLVTDALNFRVQAFDRDARFLWQVGSVGDGSGNFAAPKGVASDTEDNIYVVDALFDTVQIFDRSGNLLLAFGERGKGPGQFWLPGGIFIDAQDRIYVADAYNRRIQIFSRLQGGRGGQP